MEILSYNSPPCLNVVNLRCEFVKKGSCHIVIKSSRKFQLLCSRADNNSGSLKYSKNKTFLVGDLGHIRVSRPPLSAQKTEFAVFSGGYDGYVVGGEEGVESLTKRGESATKILIPGLPDESKGQQGAAITSCLWEWKPKLTVHYERSGCDNVESPPVLFLPGFGVGSFHYKKQLKDLGREYRVWAVDFLGQGKSLSLEDLTVVSEEGAAKEGKNAMWGFGDEAESWASELAYSLDLWRDQVRYFVEEVIGEPVYIAGNSLGGYVALYFAASYPNLVKGVTLLNATPFWGFSPNPVRSPVLAKIFPWAGTFPLPTRVRKLIEIIWEKISDPESIAEILKQVYTDHSTDVDEVFFNIVEVTRHPAAAASLASIMFAPQGQLSFDEALARCKRSKVPICLMYGKEDPWVRPLWGRKVKREMPEAPYYEISPAGHCPHDEVPEVVNYLLRGWIKNLESHGSAKLPLLDDAEDVRYSVAREMEFPREGSKKSVKVRFYGSEASLWSRITSYFVPALRQIETRAP